MIGVRRGKDLYFVKKLKNGFTRPAKREIMDAVRGLAVAKCPFVNLPERAGSRPSAVDEECGGRLRHAAFRRLIEA